MNSIVKSDMEYLLRKFGDIKKFEGKTIIIIGFAGFLGYYFTVFFNTLRTNGVHISKLILCDSYLLGKPYWLCEITDIDEIQIERFDITNESLNDYICFEETDYIIHLASVASPTYYRKYPIQTIEANVLGVRKLLEYYKGRNISGLLFFSSSEIYGDPDPEEVPIDEEYRGSVSCIGPRSCYDESKRFGETLCYYYAQIYKMPIGVARPFNNFGPGMSINDRRAPADFAKCVLNNRDIVILSDGSPKRTFCYIADAICGYLKILLNGKYDYFNIGMANPEISIREFAGMFRDAGAKLTGYDGKVLYEIPVEKDYLTHNPNRRCPQIEKARSLLGFNPEIRVEDGVERFMKYLIEEKIS